MDHDGVEKAVAGRDGVAYFVPKLRMCLDTGSYSLSPIRSQRTNK